MFGTYKINYTLEDNPLDVQSDTSELNSWNNFFTHNQGTTLMI